MGRGQKRESTRTHTQREKAVEDHSIEKQTDNNNRPKTVKTKVRVSEYQFTYVRTYAYILLECPCTAEIARDTHAINVYGA